MVGEGPPSFANGNYQCNKYYLVLRKLFGSISRIRSTAGRESKGRQERASPLGPILVIFMQFWGEGGIGQNNR